MSGDPAGLTETQWRLVWEEHLDLGARRRIWRAAFRAQALDDADEAAVAIEFARRRRRIARGAALANMLLSSALLVAIAFLDDPPVTSAYWWLYATPLGVLVMSPLVAGWWLRRLREFEHRNRAVVQANS